MVKSKNTVTKIVLTPEGVEAIADNFDNPAHALQELGIHTSEAGMFIRKVEVKIGVDNQVILELEEVDRWLEITSEIHGVNMDIEAC